METEIGRDVEIEIGSTIILIKADEETVSLAALASVCAVNASLSNSKSFSLLIIAMFL